MCAGKKKKIFFFFTYLHFLCFHLFFQGVKNRFIRSKDLEKDEIVKEKNEKDITEYEYDQQKLGSKLGQYNYI